MGENDISRRAFVAGIASAVAVSPFCAMAAPEAPLVVATSRTAIGASNLAPVPGDMFFRLADKSFAYEVPLGRPPLMIERVIWDGQEFVLADGGRATNDLVSFMEEQGAKFGRDRDGTPLLPDCREW